jgi:hypothetical protein
MPSTFSPLLRFEQIATGEQAGTWGVTTNRNIGTLIEAALAGVVTVAMADGDYTLSVVNGGTDEARNAVIVATGALTAERRIYIPPVSKLFTVRNNTTGNFGVQVKTATGSAVTVPAGRTMALYCDGLNCFDIKPLFLAADIEAALGYVPYNAANPAGYINITQLAPYAPIQSPDLLGTPTAPTAAGGTSTTQIATTAFVQAAVQASTTGVSSFMGRTGAITLQTADVTTALGYTPYNESNPTGYVTATTAPVRSVFGRTGVVSMISADVTTALGYTPYNSTNPSGFITSGALSPYLTSATAAATYAALSGATFSGYVSSPVYYINSSRTLKQDIAPVTNGALERVLSWDIKEYAYRARPEQRAIGLIAEDADPRISNGQTIDITAAVFELAQALKEAVRGNRI